VIRTFKHDGLRQYFEDGNSKKLSADMVKKLRIRLNVLNRAKELKDIALPGLGFHPLKRDRKGEYAIAVTGNYRMTFRFDNGDVLDLNLEDYH
jgi:proteic killer suppression protein